MCVITDWWIGGGEAWAPTDALLTWSYEDPEEFKASKSKMKKAKKKGGPVADDERHIDAARGQLVVHGFNNGSGDPLRCVWPADPDEDGGAKKGDDAWYNTLLKRLKGLFFSRGVVPRAPPSMANASFLLGQQVDTEDDILFVKDILSCKTV